MNLLEGEKDLPRLEALLKESPAEANSRNADVGEGYDMRGSDEIYEGWKDDIWGLSEKKMMGGRRELLLQINWAYAYVCIFITKPRVIVIMNKS